MPCLNVLFFLMWPEEGLPPGTLVETEQVVADIFSTIC